MIKLIEKTGDRIVVFDKKGNNAYVIMDIDCYENLLDNQPEKIGDMEDASDYLSAENPNWSLSNEPIPVDPVEISKKSESEVIRGIETEVVNIGENSGEVDMANDKNRYYFEEIEDELPESPAESSGIE